MKEDLGMTRSGETMTDRRAEYRQRAFKGAVLHFNRGYSSLDAVVRNFSGQGAMLSMGDTSGIPSRFEIQINGETPRMASIRWRSPLRAGIHFES